MITLNVIEAERETPATTAEMAALSFSGLPDLHGRSDKELAEISKNRADEIFNLSYLCLGQMRMGKDDLVSAIRNNEKDEVWCTFLEGLAEGQEAARALLKLFESAEARLMVAMATVDELEEQAS